MIERYTTPEMKNLWSKENKFQTWLEVELAVIQAYEDTGKVPAGTSQKIRNKSKINVKRIKEIEASTHHDVVAFVNSIIEQLDDEGRWFHFGLTSSDVVDTALSLLSTRALTLIIDELEMFIDTVKEKAREEKDTLMIGRTHGVHAEPTTLGHKLTVFAFELARNQRRLISALEIIKTGKISGAVGTYSNISPDIEARALKKLGLSPASASTQILQRDRHAEVINAIALTASTLEKLATEIRHLQKTEVLELEEPFGKGQKGSSAMPHKKNPIICERITGLSRLIRGYAATAMQNISLWHERDISHSSTERIIFPDATTVIHYMLIKFVKIIKDLKINRERMKENLNMTRGLIFSSKVLLYLIDKGLSRPEAYDIVQRCAISTWDNKNTDFKTELLKDPELKNILDSSDLEKIFNYKQFTKNIDTIISRLEEI